MSASQVVPKHSFRTYSDGLSKESEQSFMSWLVAVSTMTLYTGWMHILFGLFIASCFSWTARYILLALWSTLLLPTKPVLWSAFCRSWVFRTWREYFHFSYLTEAELDPKKTYVFVGFPHGVFPMGGLIGGTAFQSEWPFFRVPGLGASSVFSIPVWRHFLTWMGLVEATPGNYKRLLQQGSVAISVGGIAEMYMQDKKQERVMLLSRKGFVKIAVETGLDGGIVPIYYFGNTQVFDFWPPGLAGVARKYRTALGFLVGRWGAPVPRQVPLFLVMGKPIPVPKVDKADKERFDATVEDVHAKVVSALQELYDRHKASYGWQDRPLSIE